MAVSARWYGSGLEEAYKGNINFTGDTIKVALLTSAYVFSQAGHTVFGDVSANETSGTGYTAGGMTLSGKTINFATGELTLDANDVTWTTSTIDAAYAVIYKSTGALMGYVDFDGTQSSSAGDFTITWAAGGIFVIDPEPYT